ncbi:MAG: glycyl-radical enzyme activating protein [Candidatus Lokiarchaeota archaeon]|nr:glycyl-radical enzyme activating protein [Candidatus Lokiarchaeota archaeon]MBD3339402.1 glycyl-radical enzyme activating protein [Candidatus Lokiarchaeota archaeon]
MKGVIFDISHYAIYDGPGIRTIVFLKGCPLHCLWCHNPESQIFNPQVSYFREKCILCGKCVEVCPNEALIISEESVIREYDKCDVCGTCVEVCPNQVMEVVGKFIDTEEIIKQIMVDKPFYDNSGGGVTISGGEPTAQPKFLISILKALKEKGIHTAIETCGFFKESLVEKLVGLIDLFLFDIKHFEPDIHKKFTGVSNERILFNFEKIHKIVGDQGIICRIPIIPGVNDDNHAIDGITSFLKKINYMGEVHLMPYNKMAKTKYEKMGMGDIYKDMGDLTEENLNEIVERINNRGFTTVCNH